MGSKTSDTLQAESSSWSELDGRVCFSRLEIGSKLVSCCLQQQRKAAFTHASRKSHIWTKKQGNLGKYFQSLEPDSHETWQGSNYEVQEGPIR